MSSGTQRNGYRYGFTIVELLIVIVVIAVLAAITIVVFNGLQKRAIQSSLQADVDKAKKKVMLYQVENGTYPTAINCTNPSSTEICVEPSGSNTYNYTSLNTSNPPLYALGASNGSLAYQATESTPTQEGAGHSTNGLTAQLDAGNSSSYAGTGTTWNDISGSGRSATLTDVTYSTDNGGVLVFNGTTSLARISSGAVQSVFMFVYIDSSKVTVRYLMDSRTGNPAGYLYSSSGGNWTNFNANLVPISATLASIPKDRWVGFYADTTAQYTATINLMSRYSNTETLPGKLGVVLVYNRKLTQTEILQNFNAYRSRYGIVGS